MNVVEFIIKMQDGLSVPLAKVGKETNSTNNALNKLLASNKQLKTMVGSTGASVNDLRVKISKLQEFRDMLPSSSAKQIKQVNSEIEELTGKIGKLENLKGGKGLKDYFGELVSEIPAILTNPITLIGAGITESLNEGMKNSQVKLDLSNLVGAESGKTLFKGLSGMKAMLGDEVFNFGKDLVTSGMAADKVSSTLKRLGDVAGGDKNKLGVLTGSFAEMQKEGKLTESVLQSMESAGFKPLVLMSQQTGVSIEKLRQKFEQGKISAADIGKALEGATEPGGHFYGVMDKINSSPMGKWEQIKTSIVEITAKLGEVLMPIVTVIVDLLLWGFNQVAAVFEVVGNAMGVIADWGIKNKDILLGLVAVVAGAVIAYQAYNAIQKLVWMWQMKDLILTNLMTTAKGIATIATGGLSVATGILNAVMAANPIGIVITLIGALVAAVMWCWNKFDGFGQFFKNLWTIIKASFNMFVNSIKSGFETIGYRMQQVWLNIKSFGQYIGQLFSNIGDAMKLAMDFKFTEAKAKLTATIETGASKELEQLDKDHASKQAEFNKENANDLMTLLVTPLKGVIKAKDEADANTATDKAFNPDGTEKANYNSAKDLKEHNDAKTSDGINAVSGGGVKNITVTVGKMIENYYSTITQETKQAAKDLERQIEECMVRAIASATAR